MTEKEIQEATERADRIVEKVRDLVVLEGKVVEARESVRQLSANGDTAPTSPLQENLIAERSDILKGLESQLKENVEALGDITDELKLATPCFRAYVLPQMSEIVGTLKTCDAAERSELAQLVTALTGQNSLSPEELEEAIINRLKSNLERTFSTP